MYATPYQRPSNGPPAKGFQMTTVTNDEVHPRQHDRYLSIVVADGEPLGQAMLAMGVAAGRGAHALSVSECALAAAAMTKVHKQAAAFLDHLAAAHSPDYLRGADDQLRDALKLLVDAGRRGAEAAIGRDGAQLTAAAQEMDVANRDIAAAAQRIVNWRSGAARP
jgi:hypothetical protein